MLGEDGLHVLFGNAHEWISLRDSRRGDLRLITWKTNIVHIVGRYIVNLNWRRSLRNFDLGGDIVEIGGDLGRFGEIRHDFVRSGEMWEFAPGWPVPHLVWDYAAAILDFVHFFAIFVKNVDFGGFRRVWRDLARCGRSRRDGQCRT